VTSYYPYFASCGTGGSTIIKDACLATCLINKVYEIAEDFRKKVNVPRIIYYSLRYSDVVPKLRQALFVSLRILITRIPIFSLSSFRFVHANGFCIQMMDVSCEKSCKRGGVLDSSVDRCSGDARSGCSTIINDACLATCPINTRKK
jgi:hypothetical protein